jgi:hypothetical protein
MLCLCCCVSLCIISFSFRNVDVIRSGWTSVRGSKNNEPKGCSTTTFGVQIGSFLRKDQSASRAGSAVRRWETIFLADGSASAQLVLGQTLCDQLGVSSCPCTIVNAGALRETCVKVCGKGSVVSQAGMEQGKRDVSSVDEEIWSSGSKGYSRGKRTDICSERTQNAQVHLEDCRVWHLWHI